jgi:DNA-binding NarL/FixJ family response regulator
MKQKLGKPTNGKVKKVLIVDDHPVFRERLAQVISGEKGLEVCAKASSVAQGLRSAAELKPDIVLLDITLPNRSGLEVIKNIRSAHPGVKILVLSMRDEALYANRVLRLGGDGYIMKQEDPSEVVTAIHDVLDGHTYVSEGVLSSRTGKTPTPSEASDASSLDALSDSQLEILEMLGQGKTCAEIGKFIGLNSLAVASECETMRKELRLKSDNALIRYAVCWVETGAK